MREGWKWGTGGVGGVFRMNGLRQVHVMRGKANMSKERKMKIKVLRIGVCVCGEAGTGGDAKPWSEVGLEGGRSIYATGRGRSRQRL